MRSVLLIPLFCTVTCAFLIFNPYKEACLGEFQYCPKTGSCVMFDKDCNICGIGQYICPDRVTCVNSAEDYVLCPGIKGTHLDWNMPIEKRLDYLIHHANLTEKISQLTNDAPGLERFFIPSYNWLNDDEHGVHETHATSFPSGNALGATWSKKTLFQVGEAIAVEARGVHNGAVHSGNRGKNENGLGITLYAPHMNLVRDPRWGRAQEVFSEDPLLSSLLTAQFVTGMQGPPTSPYMLSAACCKHFAAYDIESIPVQRYNFSAEVDVRNMWETYMPVFRACVVEAKGSHVMCSYNSINGIPTCADPQLLNGILRDRWHFRGFVVSDYDAWANLVTTHYFSSNMTVAAAAGINAGMDQEGGGDDAIKELERAVSLGWVSKSTVDAAFRRLFRVRIRLGMLDPPSLVSYNFISNSSLYVASGDHLALARRAAEQAMTLLVNRNGALPLRVLPKQGESGHNDSSDDADRTRTLALIGPQIHMTDLLLGNYAVPPDLGVVSIFSGIRSLLYDLEGPAYPTELLWSPGCATVPCEEDDLFPKAVALAKDPKVEAVIVTLGLDQSLEAETLDREDLDLPGYQYELVHQLRKAVDASNEEQALEEGKAKKKPKVLIGVLIHGGTVRLGPILDDLDGLIDAWYPGMQGGSAIAEVLFGQYNPAGRVSVTYYQHTSQLPPMGNMDLYAYNGTTYRYFKGDVDFPFGFGLSYTNFTYQSMSLSSTSIKACDDLLLQVYVTNSGDKDGEEVVQVYLKQPRASVPVPRVRLADFERVFIPKGETVRVDLLVRPETHYVVYGNSTDIYHPDLFIESGPLELFVGGGQPGYFKGGLNATVNVSNSKNYDDCPKYKY